MSHRAGTCVLRSDMTRAEADDALNALWITEERRRTVEEKRPYELCIELTGKCVGSCSYCYSSSDEFIELSISKEKVLGLIDEALDMGMKAITFAGGEPLLHPDWYEIMSYVVEKGVPIHMATSALLSKKVCRQLVKLGIESILTNFSTLNQEIYNQVHTNPKTLEQRIRGHYNLLEAGYDPKQMGVQITLTRPIIETIEETIDWIVDELGIKYMCLLPFKESGFGSRHRNWEPSVSEVKRAIEYRAKKCGHHWLRLGSSEGSKFQCCSLISVLYNGKVAPCAVMPGYTVGSIYQESLRAIYERHRDELLFNFEIKGPCSTCENNDVCFGCRATAYAYTGDVRASDPKCFLNPEAPEYFYSSHH